ncbi:MAG TPA: D-alanyl-D-alanine carboxypeptidase [Ferruginibacter sp.]|nr:D-alanyl-D-alanine carboxypeptidase [Ferruginibacter sp.]
MNLRHFLFLVPCSILILVSCSVSKQISKQANAILLNDTAIRQGHIGICIYEPATGNYWYQHNAGKYFIPASNTKLFTLYAGMKYLGDSLVAARVKESGTDLSVYPSGDPSFLNAEFPSQPLFRYLQSFKTIYVNNNAWRSDALGYGWAWDDYNEPYMAERSSLPVYGNLMTFSLNNGTIHVTSNSADLLPNEGLDSPVKFDPETKKVSSDRFIIERRYGSNDFYVKDAGASFRKTSIPFQTGGDFVSQLLKDTLHAEDVTFFRSSKPGTDLSGTRLIHSQPSDSLFRPMMYRSDNFYAEQTLLMASNEHLGYMSDEKMIDTLFKSDLKDIPQKPKWVDGSGLSRYNLFTPQSFVYILNKMRNEFGWDRMKAVLPTGGQGTLSSYYKKETGFIYAKTGTLSNNCSLSGYLITRKGKLLIFSVLTNNYPTGATPVRRAVERFLVGIRENY